MTDVAGFWLQTTLLVNSVDKPFDQGAVHNLQVYILHQPLLGKINVKLEEKFNIPFPLCPQRQQLSRSSHLKSSLHGCYAIRDKDVVECMCLRCNSPWFSWVYVSYVWDWISSERHIVTGSVLQNLDQDGIWTRGSVRGKNPHLWGALVSPYSISGHLVRASSLIGCLFPLSAAPF